MTAYNDNNNNEQPRLNQTEVVSLFALWRRKPALDGTCSGSVLRPVSVERAPDQLVALCSRFEPESTVVKRAILATANALIYDRPLWAPEISIPLLFRKCFPEMSRAQSRSHK